MKNFFITGIGTDVGKTIATAIIIESLQSNYWKPIQCGNMHETDTEVIKKLVTHPTFTFYKESYLLQEAMSPHAAAKLENCTIEIQTVLEQYTEIQQSQKKNKSICIEGAGGLFVPLNQKFLVIDLIQKLNIETIIVSKNYLGSINHTLLTIEALQNKKIPIAGIIFNGETNEETENFIVNYSKINVIGKIKTEPIWNNEIVKKYASQFQYHF